MVQILIISDVLTDNLQRLALFAKAKSKPLLLHVTVSCVNWRYKKLLGASIQLSLHCTCSCIHSVLLKTAQTGKVQQNCPLTVCTIQSSQVKIILDRNSISDSLLLLTCEQSWQECYHKVPFWIPAHTQTHQGYISGMALNHWRIRMTADEVCGN